MLDNTTNVQPCFTTNNACHPVTSFTIVNDTVTHIMVSKSQYTAIIAENEQLRTRIAELEAELHEDVVVVAGSPQWDGLALLIATDSNATSAVSGKGI